MTNELINGSISTYNRQILNDKLHENNLEYYTSSKWDQNAFQIQEYNKWLLKQSCSLATKKLYICA